MIRPKRAPNDSGFCSNGFQEHHVKDSSLDSVAVRAATSNFVFVPGYLDQKQGRIRVSENRRRNGRIDTLCPVGKPTVGRQEGRVNTRVNAGRWKMDIEFALQVGRTGMRWQAHEFLYF